MTSRTVTTDATGRREATPDQGLVEVIVRGEGDSASTARRAARDRAATIRESVSAESAGEVITVDLQVQDTDEVFDPAADARFQADERLRVPCVPETADEVVVAVTDVGGTVQSVHFILHDDVHRRLQDEALTAAMERAREKAEHVAAAEGGVVSEVQAVTTKKQNTGMQSIVDDALAASQDVDVHPAPVVVTASVEVVYELGAE